MNEITNKVETLSTIHKCWLANKITYLIVYEYKDWIILINLPSNDWHTEDEKNLVLPNIIFIQRLKGGNKKSLLFINIHCIQAHKSWLFC